MSVFLIHPFESLRGLRLFLIATPNNQRKTISLGEPNAVEPFQCHAQRLIRKHCMMEKDFCGIKVPRLARSCHMILAAYRPPLLSEKNQCSTDPIDNGPAMWAMFVDLCWDFHSPLIYCHNLMDDRPKKCILFYFIFHFFIFLKFDFRCFNFVPNDIPLRGSGRGVSFHHLRGINFLKALCLVIHFLPFFAKVAKKGVTTNEHGQRTIDQVF